MGKKRSISVKRIAELLVEHQQHSRFTSDFEENKKLVSEMIQLPYKTARNKIAGHITHNANRKTSEIVRPEVEGDEE